MDSRKAQILQIVIDTHIKTALPVGSVNLAGMGELGVSGATIRNELRALEEAGYLTHPHTSAGRIPTEKGYEHYLENCTLSTQLAKALALQMEKAKALHTDSTLQIKEVAKVIAEKSQGAVIVAFDQRSLYYTGISYLFSQVEFRDFAQTVEISTIFDQCEDKIEVLDETLNEGVSVLIGNRNPLGRACSTVGTRLPNGTLFLLLGPMRMNYGQNMAMINHLRTIFES